MDVPEQIPVDPIWEDQLIDFELARAPLVFAIDEARSLPDDTKFSKAAYIESLEGLLKISTASIDAVSESLAAQQKIQTMVEKLIARLKRYEGDRGMEGA